MLVMFAPAHRGATIGGLVMGALLSINIGNVIVSGVKYRFPVLRDLSEAHGFLEDLHTDTKKLLEDKGNRYLRARAVVQAEPDPIVNNDTFASDPEPVSVKGLSHFAVCKPNMKFTLPVDVLMGVL